jgi:hypothetical protein
VAHRNNLPTEIRNDEGRKKMTEPDGIAFTPHLSPRASGGMLPGAVEVDQKFEIKNLPHKPLGPFSIGVGGFVLLKGSAGRADARTTLSHTRGETSVDFAHKVESSFEELEVSGSIDYKDYKKSHVGIQLGALDFAFELALTPSLTETVTIKITSPPISQLKRHFKEWEFKGTVQAALEVKIGPNRVWPGWATVARGTVRVAGRAGNLVVRGVTFLGEAVTAEVFTTVLVVAGAMTAAVGWLGFGLYMIGKAHRDGDMEACGYSFSNGYAEMLAKLTSDPPYVPTPTVAKLLAVDWRTQFSENRKRYVSSGGRDQSSVGQMTDAGRAAVLQDIDRIVKERGFSVWQQYAVRQRNRYGANYEIRRRAYLSILYSHVQHEDKIGIPLQ